MNLLIDDFSGLNDPGEKANVRSPLTHVWVIAASAAIAGAESYEPRATKISSSTERVRRPGSRHSGLDPFLDLTTWKPGMETQHGIPSHDTFRRTFRLMDGEAFEPCFTA